LTNGRNKGRAGEQEFCHWITNNLGVEVTPERNLEQVRSGGSDICNVYPFIFEVKRCESLDLQAFWNQVKFAWEYYRERDDETIDVNLIPVVAFRQNRKPWEFLVSAELIKLELGFVRLDSRTFIRWAKRQLIMYQDQQITDMCDVDLRRIL